MKLLDQPRIDPYGYLTVAEYGGWNVTITEMIFNYRLLLVPKHDPYSVDYGWCYPKGPAALLAVRLWTPETEAEPLGFIKRVNAVPRQAGETALERTSV